MTATKGFSDDFFHTHCLETGDFFFSNVKFIKQSLLRLRDQDPVIIFSKEYLLELDKNFSPI